MTTNFINYTQILDDVKTLIETKVTGATKPYKHIATNLQVRDFNFQNMPICDVRLGTADPQGLAGQNYYTGVLVELEIAAFDLRSKDQAARIANELLAKTQRALLENAHFGSTWDSIILGHVDFITAEKDKEGFAASIVAQVTINVYSDQ